MERRELLKMITILTGGALIGGEILPGCSSGPAIGGATFTPADIAFLDEVAETIIPATTTPGAKAAKVGTFMTVMVNDTYEAKNQTIFHEGIKKLNDASQKANGKGFVESTPEQRKSLLIAIDKEAKDAQAANKDKKDADHHYFTMMKQLTLLGYFTSKEGATQALRYLPLPGKYDGNYPYKKGDKAWATS